MKRKKRRKAEILKIIFIQDSENMDVEEERGQPKCHMSFFEIISNCFNAFKCHMEDGRAQNQLKKCHMYYLNSYNELGEKDRVMRD